MLEIGWKSFGIVGRPCFEVVNFGYLRKSSRNLGQSSEVVGHLRQSSEVFRNLWQSLEAVGKSLEIQVQIY